MVALAGPGPSTVAASSPSFSRSPSVRGKRSTINLVNPADPSEFSSMSPRPLAGNERVAQMRNEEGTPMSGTPLAVRNLQRDTVKGILRSSGTPGSGNGVRFFPKNKFRVITPNQSLHLSSSDPDPPKSPSNSFLSQLLSVVPSISPRRPTSQTVKVDESWEIPGQEGEVSLVASSNTSLNHSQSVLEDGEEQEEEREPWSGQPEIHSSPLGLPAPLDEDVSEVVSQDMLVPEDMSNLMMEKLSMSGIASFSMASPSRSRSPQPREESEQSLDPASFLQTLRPNRVALPVSQTDPRSRGSSPDPAQQSSPLAQSISSPPPPLGTRSPSSFAPTSPSPSTPNRDDKPFRSIFADMSAEQADISWPLIKHSPAKSPLHDDTPFHSAIELLPQSPRPVSSPAHNYESPLPRPKSRLLSTPGNGTAYFDCSSATPSPVFPTSSSSNSLELRTPSPLALGLIPPTKAVFDAHSAHASALSNELGLYQRLVSDLQDEVAERDSVLANLNIRALEAEVWRTKYEDLQAEVTDLRRTHSSPIRKLSLQDEQTPSPTPIRYADGNRTTVEEALNRDLEIRLSKALADLAAMSAEVQKVKKEREEFQSDLNNLQRQLGDAQHGAFDGTKEARRADDELRSQLEAVTRRERALHAQLAEAQDQAREAGLERELERGRVQEAERRLASALRANTSKEKEMADLHDVVRGLERDHARVQEESARLLAVAQNEIGEARRDVETLRRELREVQDQKLVAEEQAQGLQQSLKLARKEMKLASVPPAPSSPSELARLRSESASKDLEIAALHRRKGELKDDLEMLNIALDSKQQELELLKRRFSVRGIAGCTPLATSRRISSTSNNLSELETPAPSKAAQGRGRRLSSMTLVTPSMGDHNGRMLKPRDSALGRSSTKASLRSVAENVAARDIINSVSVRRSSTRQREMVAA